MADTKISALAELTTPADNDEVNIVDKSDTSFASTGTNKRISVQNLRGPAPTNIAKTQLAQAVQNELDANTAKHGLYPTSVTPVGVWRGVSGNPSDSTTISTGTAQFDGGSIYLSRTDANGNAISVAQLPAVGAAITFAEISTTVSAISENSNRIKLDLAGSNQPLAAQGHHYSLYNVADPNHTTYGVHTKGALEGDGAPSMELDVRDGGIGSAKLDLASGETITAGQAVVYRANGEFGSSPLGSGGATTTIPNWSNNSAYAQYDVVAVNRVIYRAKQAISAPPQGTTNVSPTSDTTNWESLGTSTSSTNNVIAHWDKGAAYSIDDQVEFGGHTYEAEAAVTAVARIPTPPNSNWRTGVEFTDRKWLPFRSYAIGDKVLYNGKVYRATQAITFSGTVRAYTNSGVGHYFSGEWRISSNYIVVAFNGRQSTIDGITVQSTSTNTQSEARQYLQNLGGTVSLFLYPQTLNNNPIDNRGNIINEQNNGSNSVRFQMSGISNYNNFSHDYDMYIVSNPRTNPASDTANWTVEQDSYNFATAYTENDTVIHNNEVFVAQSNLTGVAPSTLISRYTQSSSPGSNGYVQYNTQTGVFSFQLTPSSGSNISTGINGEEVCIYLNDRRIIRGTVVNATEANSVLSFSINSPEYTQQIMGTSGVSPNSNLNGGDINLVRPTGSWKLSSRTLFNNESGYAIGDTVAVGNTIYTCTTAITQPVFNSDPTVATTTWTRIGGNYVELVAPRGFPAAPTNQVLLNVNLNSGQTLLGHTQIEVSFDYQRGSGIYVVRGRFEKTYSGVGFRSTGAGHALIEQVLSWGGQSSVNLYFLIQRVSNTQVLVTFANYMSPNNTQLSFTNSSSYTISNFTIRALDI